MSKDLTIYFRKLLANSYYDLNTFLNLPYKKQLAVLNSDESKVKIYSETELLEHKEGISVLRNLVERHHFDKAKSISDFKRFAENYPNSVFMQECQFRIKILSLTISKKTQSIDQRHEIKELVSSTELAKYHVGKDTVEELDKAYFSMTSNFEDRIEYLEIFFNSFHDYEPTHYQRLTIHLYNEIDSKRKLKNYLKYYPNNEKALLVQEFIQSVSENSRYYHEFIKKEKFRFINDIEWISHIYKPINPPNTYTDMNPSVPLNSLGFVLEILKSVPVIKYIAAPLQRLKDDKESLEKYESIRNEFNIVGNKLDALHHFFTEHLNGSSQIEDIHLISRVTENIIVTNNELNSESVKNYTELFSTYPLHIPTTALKRELKTLFGKRASFIDFSNAIRATDFDFNIPENAYNYEGILYDFCDQIIGKSTPQILTVFNELYERKPDSGILSESVRFLELLVDRNRTLLNENFNE